MVRSIELSYSENGSDGDTSGYDSGEGDSSSSDDDVVVVKHKGRARNSTGSGAGVDSGRTGNATRAAGAGSGGDDKCLWKKWVTEANPHGFSPAAFTRLSKLSGPEREEAEQKILKNREKSENRRHDPEKHENDLLKKKERRDRIRADPEKLEKLREQQRVYNRTNRKQRANNNQTK